MYILFLFFVFSFVAIVESSWDDEFFREEIREEVRKEKQNERKVNEGDQL
tara:strand:+ start:451 stop:600 length:150 start_codon:yes stop_codon:yes gene_type:complete